MYVYGLKRSLLSVSQMLDQGNEFIFSSKECVVPELDTGKIVIKGNRTPRNMYILKGDQERCCLGKYIENWLWYRRWDI